MGLYIKHLVKTFARDCFNIIYPPLCLHCEAPLEKNRTFFCTECLAQLALIDSQERCAICFIEKDLEKKCIRCSARYVVIKRQAAACEAQGPGRTLVGLLEKGNMQLLSAASALMALQFAMLNWPPPDLIIPLPSPFLDRYKRGGDIAKLLAEEVAILLQKPLISPLRTAFDKAAFLRKGELQSTFNLKKRERLVLCEKRLLLIALQLDDVHLRCAAEVLQESFPQEIYALTLSIN